MLKTSTLILCQFKTPQLLTVGGARRDRNYTPADLKCIRRQHRGVVLMFLTFPKASLRVRRSCSISATYWEHTADDSCSLLFFFLTSDFVLLFKNANRDLSFQLQSSALVPLYIMFRLKNGRRLRKMGHAIKQPVPSPLYDYTH